MQSNNSSRWTSPYKVYRIMVDYFIQVHSSAATIHILTKGFVHVSTYTLTLMPWTPDYGSITVPLHTQLNSDPINHDILSRSRVLPHNRHLTIEITGMPIHICCDLAIRRLFSRICTIRDITFFTPATLTYWVSDCGPELLVPSIAYVGVKKATQNGDFLNVWPLWYETTTSDMVGFESQPDHLATTSQRRGKTFQNHRTIKKHIRPVLNNFRPNINRMLRT